MHQFSTNLNLNRIYKGWQHIDQEAFREYRYSTLREKYRPIFYEEHLVGAVRRSSSNGSVLLFPIKLNSKNKAYIEVTI